VIVRISPTRMELIRLRRRLIIAQRGHKLLEDKLEGLMKEFLTLVEEYRVLRLELARELPAAFARFALGSATSSPKIIDLALRECEKEIENYEYASSAIHAQSFQTEPYLLRCNNRR
jgi:V/A-type H+-transporting ATPase subunit D